MRNRLFSLLMFMAMIGSVCSCATNANDDDAAGDDADDGGSADDTGIFPDDDSAGDDAGDDSSGDDADDTQDDTDDDIDDDLGDDSTDDTIDDDIDDDLDDEADDDLDDDLDDDAADDDIDDDLDDDFTDDAADDDTAQDIIMEGYAPEMTVEYVDGGAPGLRGTSVVVKADGSVHVSAIMGRHLFVYSSQGKHGWTERLVAEGVIMQWMALGADEFLRILYVDKGPGQYRLATETADGWTEEPLGFDSQRLGAVDRDGFVHFLYFESGVLNYATNRSGGWTTDIIDADHVENTAFDVDADGFAHVVITEYSITGDPDQVFYATNRGGSWHKEIVEPGSTFSYRWSSLGIAATPDGHAYLYYDGWETHSEYSAYATNVGGYWQSFELAMMPEGEYAEGDAIATDADGHVHICWHKGSYNPYPYYLTFLCGNDRSGVYETTFSSEDSFDSSNLFADAAGAPYLSFYRNGLRLLESAGGVYSESLVRENEDHGHELALAVGPNGPEVAYFDASLQVLRWGERSADGWTTTPIEPVASWGPGTSAAFDGLGRLWLAYSDGDEHALKAAIRDGADWTTETIIGDVKGDFPSIAIDSGGAPHVAYHDPVALVLMYASRTENGWVTELADGGATVGRYASLALDAQDVPHVSYCGDADLRYAVREARGWTVVTVDAGHPPYELTALGLDANGAAHIVYHRPYQDYPDDGLYYATNESGAWTTLMISMDGLPTGSIHVDPDGSVQFPLTYRGHLCYATDRGGVWRQANLNDEPNLNAAPMAVTPEGRVHIIYAVDSAVWHVEFDEP